MNIQSIFAATVFTMLLAPQYALAQQAATSSYDDEIKKTSQQINEKLENAVIPISNSLKYLLTSTLPDVDGEFRPIGFSITHTIPADPDAPLAIQYHCPWGRTVCEPFFRACSFFLLDCTE